MKLSDLSLKDKPTCSDCRETGRKYCILPLWKRGSKLCLMVSVCHPSSLGCGGGSHTFLGRECPQRNALRVTGLLPLEQDSSHNHQGTRKPCQEPPQQALPRNTFPDFLPQSFSLIATKHLEGAWWEEACREGTLEEDPGDTPLDCK